MSGPLGGAQIRVEQLDLATGAVSAMVGETTADAAGAFALETGSGWTGRTGGRW